MRAVLGATLIFACMFLVNPARAENRCTCPQVSARGVGDTSCSASESNGTCTVDFNIFGPERERRAVELLSLQMKLQTPDPDQSSVDALSRANDDQIVDFVLLYLTVGLGDRVAGGQVSVGSARETLKGFDRLQRDARSAINEMFGRAMRVNFPPGPDPSPNDVRSVSVQSGDIAATLSPGCIEVTNGEMWMMFKLSWAQARLAPRCSSPR